MKTDERKQVAPGMQKQTEAPEQTGMLAALEVEHLHIWMNDGGRRIPAVRDLSLSVRAGGCTGVIGESGCGKSLSCQALLGLLEPRKWTVEGTVRLGSAQVPILDDRAMDGWRGSRLALIAQDPLAAFDQRLTVGAHFCLGLPPWERRRRRECLRAAAERLETMQVHDPESVLASYPFQLSGGMLQRALTALAISRQPEVLVADEPTTALDASTQRELLELLKSLQQKEKISVMLVSHDLDVISQMADRITVMYAGEAVETGAAAEVLAHPQHPYTQGLLRSRPAFSKERLVAMEGYPPRLGDIPETGCAFAPRCPHAAERCSGRQVLREVTPGHAVRCWHS